MQTILPVSPLAALFGFTPAPSDDMGPNAESFALLMPREEAADQVFLPGLGVILEPVSASGTSAVLSCRSVPAIGDTPGESLGSVELTALNPAVPALAVPGPLFQEKARAASGLDIIAAGVRPPDMPISRVAPEEVVDLATSADLVPVLPANAAPVPNLQKAVPEPSLAMPDVDGGKPAAMTLDRLAKTAAVAAVLPEMTLPDTETGRSTLPDPVLPAAHLSALLPGPKMIAAEGDASGPDLVMIPDPRRGSALSPAMMSLSGLFDPPRVTIRPVLDTEGIMRVGNDAERATLPDDHVTVSPAPKPSMRPDGSGGAITPGPVLVWQGAFLSDSATVDEEAIAAAQSRGAETADTIPADPQAKVAADALVKPAAASWFTVQIETGREMVAPVMPNGQPDPTPGEGMQIASLPAVTAVASPPVPPGTGLPNLPQLAGQMAATLAKQPDGQLEIALSPAELGHLRLTLQADSRDPERVIVALVFDRPETLDLFRRHADQLAESLRAAGFAGADLSFAHAGSDGQGTDRREAHTPVGDVTLLDHPAPETGVATPGRVPSGALDLRL